MKYTIIIIIIIIIICYYYCNNNNNNNNNICVWIIETILLLSMSIITFSFVYLWRNYFADAFWSF